MTVAPLLVLDDVHRRFTSAGRTEAVVRGVSLSLSTGETLGIVGESGSGKTTLGRIAVGLDRPDAGRILLHGADMATLEPVERRRHFLSCQMIFQDPHASLNPRLTVGRQISEALRAAGMHHRPTILARLVELFEHVSLKLEQIDRYPHELSGGERQRVAIARALAARPAVIIADEPTSLLDAAIRSSILDLLAKIQQEDGIAYLLISHDIAAVARMSDRIAVMHRGRIVEFGPAGAVITEPAHPYTRNILDAIPRLEREAGPRCPPAPLPLHTDRDVVAFVSPGHGVLCAQP